MLKIYDKICVDVISKSKEVNNGAWKFYSIMFLSGFLSILLMALVIILKAIFSEFTNFSYLSNYNTNSLNLKIEAIVIYLVPALIINYFIVFFNDRYKKLLVLYKPQNGKYMVRFMLFSLFIYITGIFI